MYTPADKTDVYQYDYLPTHGSERQIRVRIDWYNGESVKIPGCIMPGQRDPKD